ncbi:hypothetical protein PUR61_26985 [Streptomyces sp. BE20]|uniref:hypothetical protein n=1 Tax=Streptomyces sp. BE20 TaxID=3002525 RepID=UPI002E772A65|nr:hypothetical protein [Streptomyces sp. BE20]MEE1825806.1 hypothetical protein [Streptomyces sp. BE20]
MQPVRIDRSDPDVLDLVLWERGGSLRYAFTTSLGSALAVPALFLVGALASGPMAVLMLLTGTGWGPVWSVAALIGGAAAVAGWAFLTRSAFHEVHRLRFAPADGPATVALVRGARVGRPMPVTELRRIRIDRSPEAPHGDDPRPAALTVTLTAQFARHRLAPKSLPPDTDADALHRELRAALSPAVPVELRIRHRPDPEPGPPDTPPDARPDVPPGLPPAARPGPAPPPPSARARRRPDARRGARGRSRPARD